MMEIPVHLKIDVSKGNAMEERLETVVCGIHPINLAKSGFVMLKHKMLILRIQAHTVSLVI
jgi:hypothetical protein